MEQIKIETAEELEDPRLSPVHQDVPDCLIEAHTPCASPVKDDDTELEELEKLGAEIDEIRNYQDWLRKPEVKKVINSDPRYMLYRLPLSDAQREKVYQALMKNSENNKENENRKKEKRLGSKFRDYLNKRDNMTAQEWWDKMMETWPGSGRDIEVPHYDWPLKDDIDKENDLLTSGDN